MKCPNCNAEVFEGDKFCGECGYDLSNHTPEPASKNENMKEPESDDSMSSQAGHFNQGKDNRKNGDAKSYFIEALNFFKDSIVSPGKMIGSGHRYNISVTSGTIGMLVLITALITFIQMRSDVGVRFITFSTFFEILILMLITVAVFFGLTYLMLSIVTRHNKPWQRIFNDFAVPVLIIHSLFIAAALLNLITLFEIGAIFILIGFLLFLSTPIYIPLRYAQSNTVRFDSYYSMIIYFVVVAIVFYVIGRIFILTIVSSFLDDLGNMTF